MVVALAFSKVIQGCFHEGQNSLPGPPTNLSVRVLSQSRALVFWEEPKKNAEAVEIYRVYWRPVGKEDVTGVNTMQRSLVLNGLEAGSTYEVAVKAANGKGGSQLTSPLVFKFTGFTSISSRQSNASLPSSTNATSPPDSSWTSVPDLYRLGSSHKRMSFLLASLAFLGLAAIVIFVIKRRWHIIIRNPSTGPTVAFENTLEGVGSLTRGPAVEIRTPSPLIEEETMEEVEEMERAMEETWVQGKLSRAAAALQSMLTFPKAGAGFTRFQ